MKKSFFIKMVKTDQDVSAPTLSAASDSTIDDHSGSITVTTDEAGGFLYWFVSTSATPPSSSNLKSGTGATSYGRYGVAKSGLQSIVASGLASNTTYYAHFLHSDRGGNDSNIASGNGFTTSTGITSPILLSVYAYENRLIVEGDDITAASNSYADQYFAEYSTISYVDSSANSSAISDLETRKSGVLSQIPEIVTVLIGANDLRNTSLYPDEQDWLDDLFSYTDDVRAAGAKVVLCTVLPIYLSGNSSATTTHNTRRAIVNEAIRDSIDVHCDVVCDFDTIVMGNTDAVASNTYYYSDGIIPSSNGQASLYSLYETAVNTAFETVPNVFNLPGDKRPAYNINYVDAQPTGGGLGDILQIRWGNSEANAALMNPIETTIIDDWWIDGIDPFIELGDFGETLAAGNTVYYQVRIRRNYPTIAWADSSYSPWSNFESLSISDGIMSAPGWTDLTSETANTRVWSEGITVAGMDSGSYARLKGTGPLKVGSIEYEANTEVKVKNGDTLYAGVDTSATGGATVNNDVTNRGVALETFSATTAGAAVEATHRSTQIRNYSYGSTPGTAWDSFTIEDGDKVVLHVHANENVGSLSGITGNSGTITFTQVGSPVSSGNDRVSLWYADTSGVTSISLDFAVGSSVKGMGFTAFSVVGASSGAPAASAKSYASVSGEDAHDIDGGLAAAADGVLLLTACTPNESVGDFVWTGATESAEVDTTPSAMSSAIQTTAAAVSIAGPNVGGLGYTPLGRIASQWDPA